MFRRLKRFCLRISAAAFLIAAPPGPAFDARAASGVLDHLQVFSRGLFETVYAQLRQTTGVALELLTPIQGWPAAPGELLRFGRVAASDIAPAILKMVIGRDGIATLTGRAAPGSIVYLQSDGQTVGQARVPSSGTWQLQLSTRLDQGDYSLQSLVRAPDGREVMRGPAIRVAVPRDFEGPAVVYEDEDFGSTPVRPAPKVPDRVHIGQADDEQPGQSGGGSVRERPQVGNGRARPTATDGVVSTLILQWLNNSSAAYQGLVIPDLSGQDVTFPLALPGTERQRDLAAAGARRLQRNGDTDEALSGSDRTAGEEWPQPGLSDWIFDGTGFVGARLRDWFAEARRIYGSNVVPELSTGEPVTPDRRPPAVPTEEVAQSRPTSEPELDAERPSRRSVLPWPVASDPPERPATEPPAGVEEVKPLPDIAAPDDAGPDRVGDSGQERRFVFPWPLASERGPPDPQVETTEPVAGLSDGERRAQEERIREAQQKAEEARKQAQEAAERTRKAREETERLLAEEERLKAEAAEQDSAREASRQAELRRLQEEARRKDEAARKAAAEQAAAEEEQRKAEAEAVRQRAEDLARAASEEADRQLAEAQRRSETGQERTPPTSWPVVEEGRKFPRRLSLKDSPEDLVEEGSTLGNEDNEEVYIPDAAPAPAARSRSASVQRKKVRRASSKRKRAIRARASKPRGFKRKAKRHRKAKRVAGYKRRHASKRRAYKRRVHKQRYTSRRALRGYSGRNSYKRRCVRRELRYVRRAIRRHFGRSVRGNSRYRRSGLFIRRWH